MTKHKTEDYKISAVKYYLNNEKEDKTKKKTKPVKKRRDRTKVI
jgi:hypothetical protein